MMAIEVRLFENHGLSPAVTMGQRMHLELLDAGMRHPADPLPLWNDPALVAYDGDLPVGAIIYRHDPSQACWFVLCAYVVPRRRREGIHTLLFNTLVERAKKRGDINSIQSGAHVDNLASRKSMEKQGRVAVAVYYQYTLKDFDAPKDPLETPGLPEGSEA